MRTSRCIRVTWSQHIADRRTVTAMYAALVRKGVLQYDAAQWAMAEACTPLLMHIRRATRPRHVQATYTTMTSATDANATSLTSSSTSASSSTWWSYARDATCRLARGKSGDDEARRNAHAHASTTSKALCADTPMRCDDTDSDDCDCDAWWQSTTAQRGLYLWGDVGTGKTMMLDLFTMCELPCAHRRAHLHAFMTDLVARLARAERTLHAVRRQPHLLLAATTDAAAVAASSSSSSSQEHVQEHAQLHDGVHAEQQQWQHVARLRRLVEATCAQQQAERDRVRWQRGWRRWCRGGGAHMRATIARTRAQGRQLQAQPPPPSLRHQQHGTRQQRESALAGLRPIDLVVDEVLHESPVLCFDEFQTVDVAHAALLASFFRLAFAKGLFLLTTSNRAPHELCRVSSSFDGFVPLLRTYCHVLHCRNEHDYRRSRPCHEHCHARVFVWPSTPASIATLVRRVERGMLHAVDDDDSEARRDEGEVYTKCAEGLAAAAAASPHGSNNNNSTDDDDERAACTSAATTLSSSPAASSPPPRTQHARHAWREAVALHHHGRCMYVQYSCREVALFDFADVCGDRQRLASSDYEVLARHYHTVVLVNVPPMRRVSRNAVQQFVLLIDELYQHNVKLLMATQVPWQQLTVMGHDEAGSGSSSGNDATDKRLRASNDDKDDGESASSSSTSSSASEYYTEDADERSGYATRFTFANDEDLASLRRVHSRLHEMGTTSYLLRDHAHFVVSHYNFDALVHD